MTTAWPPTLYASTQFFRGNSRAHRFTGRSSTWCFQILCCAALFAALPRFSVAQSLTPLFSFNQTDGANPYGTLIQGADGNFYGTTETGGAYAEGSVYEITPSGVETVLHSFCSSSNCSDGVQPFAGLTLASNGNFYGATNGTFFSITPSGDLTTLYKFCSLSQCADGQFVYGTPVQGRDGNFYGTTNSGGISTYTCGGSCGTIFKITPAGALTTLYDFRGKDGYGPLAGLIQGSDGFFYGTATRGGAHGKGVIFKISSSGAYTLLHSFGGADGYAPDGPLLQARDGDFYGTTNTGGAYGIGVVFKITSGGNFTVVRSFDPSTGCNPYAGLLQASDGNLYGTTYRGGTNNFGTVFKMTTTGNLKTIYKFCSETNCADGNQPYAGLTQGSDGNIYGTTVLGGANGGVCGADGSCGTVFKITPAKN